MTTAIATTDRAPTTPRAATAAPKKDPATGKWGFVCDVVSPDGRRHQTRRKGFATCLLYTSPACRGRSVAPDGR